MTKSTKPIVLYPTSTNLTIIFHASLESFFLCKKVADQNYKKDNTIDKYRDKTGFLDFSIKALVCLIRK
jgi:hypothetical protein